MKNKIKYLMPVIAASAIIPGAVIVSTSCSTSQPTLDTFMNQYNKFYNNYKNGTYKDYRYATSDLYTNIVVELKEKGTPVTVNSITYDPVDDKMEFVTDTSSKCFNVDEPNVVSAELKVFETIYHSSEYTISNDEISAVYKDKDGNITFSLAINKYGYVTEGYNEGTYMKIAYNAAPTTPKYETKEKFILKYKDLYKKYTSSILCYTTNDIGTSLQGTYTVEGSDPLTLKSISLTASGEKATFSDDTTNCWLATHDTPKSLYITMNEEIAKSDEQQFFLEGDEIGFEFKKNGSIIYSYKFNKNGYMTKSIYVDSYSQTNTISITYSKDPDHPKWEE